MLAISRFSAFSPVRLPMINLLFLVLSMLFLAFPTSGETAGWTKTGDLATPRYDHTATLLGNGKVLVAGGGNPGSLNSAELYNPATGSWSDTGPMAAARYRHTATLLPNGKVLVAGGANSGVVTASAELYDPDTGTWSSTAPLATGRCEHTATLLPNGKVLVVGGGTGIPLLNSAELYDPGTETWSPTGSLATARTHHAATLLGKGKVLVVGGAGAATCELYDSGTWSPISSLPTSYAEGATLLPNGKVLVAGSYAMLYDPATGTWNSTGSPADGRVAHKATLVSYGKVLIMGGLTFDMFGHPIYLTSTELYDPVRGTWTATGSLNTSRTAHTATRLSNGQVLVAGGTGESGILNSSELYGGLESVVNISNYFLLTE